MSSTHASTHLGLLASSVAGRPIDVADGADGERTWTDGDTVFVDRSLERRHQVQAVAVQAALIAAGSLDAELVRPLAGRGALAHRYLAAEAPRALAANEQRLPNAARALVVPTLEVGADAAASLAKARAGRGAVELPAVLGALHPRALLARAATTAAVEGGSAQHRMTAPPQVVERDGAEGDEASIDPLRAFRDTSGAGGALGRLLQRVSRFDRSSGSGLLGGDGPTRGRVVLRTAGGSGRGTPVALAHVVDTVATRPGLRYPEWDVRRRSYRADWCTVTEEPPPREGRPPERRPARALRSALTRLGLGLEPTHRRRQGEDVDVDAVVEAHVERAAGLDPTDALYIESLRRRHELAVLVMVDVSGSSAEPGAAGRTVHEHQLEAAAALAEALHALGNRVAIQGFFSQGRDSVRVVPVKRFTDPMDRRVLARLGGLAPGAYTRFGAAIRYATDVLDDEGGGSRRLLVVLSDGFAYDHGYHGAYGEADARRALVEARRRGVGCVCLSVGAATDLAALRRVFGSAAHARVRRSDDLPRIIGPVVRDALRSADLQRRNAVRAGRARRRREAERRSA